MSREKVDLVRRAYKRLAEQGALKYWAWLFDQFADEQLEAAGLSKPRTWRFDCIIATEEGVRAHDLAALAGG